MFYVFFFSFTVFAAYCSDWSNNPVNRFLDILAEFTSRPCHLCVFQVKYKVNESSCILLRMPATSLYSYSCVIS